MVDIFLLSFSVSILPSPVIAAFVSLAYSPRMHQREKGRGGPSMAGGGTHPPDEGPSSEAEPESQQEHRTSTQGLTSRKHV